MTSIAARKLKLLNGVFCIFKPPELNDLPCRPIKQRVIFPEDNANNSLIPDDALHLVPDLSDHPLVIGDRFIDDDITLRFSAKMKKEASGVLVVGINNSKKMINEIARKQYIRVYHIKCELGVCTKDMWVDSDIRRRTTYALLALPFTLDHVTSAKLDKTIAATQSLEQKHMYKIAGIVDMQSEKAYLAAKSGFMKPRDTSLGSVVYGIRCIHYKPPLFTLEVHSIYESTITLAIMVENLGLSLKSSAAVHSIRRIRYGPFQLDDAILRRNWTIDGILDSLHKCQHILDQSEGLKSLPAGNQWIDEHLSEFNSEKLRIN